MEIPSSFNVDGLISGLDTASIVKKLMEVESQPLEQLAAREAELKKRLAAWRSLNTRLLALTAPVERLADPELFQSRRASSGDPDVVTARAEPGGDAGTYVLSVEALARAHQLISQGYADPTEPVGEGTVTVQVGPALFEPITVGPEEATLEGLRDAINSAGLGVAASILDQGAAAGTNRYRLVLTSGTSGSAGELAVTFDLAGGTAPLMGDLQPAQDAHLRFGSGAGAVDVYSSSNTLTEVIPGVTLELRRADPGVPVEISLAPDSKAVRTAVEGMIDSYNALADFFAEQLSYDPATGKSGELFGESTLLELQARLADEVLDRRYVAGEFSSLSQVGITPGAGGRLAISDQEAFSRALEKPEELQKLFADATSGVAVRLRERLASATDTISGTVLLEEQKLELRLEDLAEQKRRTQERLARTEERLRKQFLEMERALAVLQSQSRQLQAQLTAFAKGP